MNTIDDVYNNCYWKDCIKQVINGPILKDLTDELLKYGIELHSKSYW